MKRQKITYLIIIALIFVKSPLFSQQELSAEKIYDMVNNSVVVVLAYDNTGNMYQGSGVVISNDGWVVTNYHVCKDADKIEIKHYTNEFKNVETIVSDEQKDILILKVKNLSLKPLQSVNGSNLKPGQRIYAIGSPEGYENSISEGIISGFRNDENNIRLIQMTTPITDGSSGGAVVNSSGELIGLSMSGQHEGSLYFALPVSEILNLLGTKTNITESEDQLNYFEVGTKATEKENYKEAEFYFTKYLDKFSNDFAAYYNRGYARFKLKEYKNAISDFSKVVEYDSSDEKSYFYRGNCYYFSKDFKNAYSDYSRAINLNSYNADLYYNRGFSALKLNNYAAAVKDWEKAIELEPEYSKELAAKINSAKEKLRNSK
ncbi:MAG TPA: trypsin-like peptidase domain-containing protein [Ignavibacteria bacterium]|jgi:tetratricopeptide (TPR) repeat protein